MSEALSGAFDTCDVVIQPEFALAGEVLSHKGLMHYLANRHTSTPFGSETPSALRS